MVLEIAKALSIEVANKWIDKERPSTSKEVRNRYSLRLMTIYKEQIKDNRKFVTILNLSQDKESVIRTYMANWIEGNLVFQIQL